EDGIRDVHVTGVQTCALPISACDQQDELFAAIASQDGAGPQPLAKLHAEVPQCAVARLVAKLVIEALEVVDIDHRERQWTFAQTAFALEALELALESAPVEGAGELVDQHLATRIGEAGLELPDPFPQRFGAAARALEALARSRDLAAHRSRFPNDRIDDAPGLLGAGRLAGPLRMGIELPGESVGGSVEVGDPSLPLPQGLVEGVGAGQARVREFGLLGIDMAQHPRRHVDRLDPHWSGQGRAHCIDEGLAPLLRAGDSGEALADLDGERGQLVTEFGTRSDPYRRRRRDGGLAVGRHQFGELTPWARPAYGQLVDSPGERGRVRAAGQHSSQALALATRRPSRHRGVQGLDEATDPLRPAFLTVIRGPAGACGSP